MNEIDNPASTSITADRTVIITDYQFVPQDITASAGDVVTFINEMDVPVTIISESAPDTFDQADLFDPLAIDIQSVGIITLPEEANVGDQFYYYNGLLESTMITANGTITIE